MVYGMALPPLDKKCEYQYTKDGSHPVVCFGVFEK